LDLADSVRLHGGHRDGQVFPHEVEEGEVVKVDGVKYTVVFSRYLNENDAEDTAYLVGPYRELLNTLRKGQGAQQFDVTDPATTG